MLPVDDSANPEPRGSAYLRDHEDRLAWIMGSSRSGSTWLLRMLCDLDGVAGIDDPHLGHHLGVWRPQPIAWAVAAETPELTTLAELKSTDHDFFFSDEYRDAWVPALRELIRARFGAQLTRSEPRLADPTDACRSAPTLVVKEPGCQSAEMLFDLFAGSRLIFLLRDGRDVVDSWLDGYRRGSWAIERGAFAAARTGRPALASWLGAVWAYRTRAVGRAFDRLPDDRRVLVRYESLRLDTAGELRRVCRALAIEAGPDECEAIARRHAYEHVSSTRRGTLREVRSAEPGRWRLRPAAERRAMHAAMATELAAWGYEGLEGKDESAGARVGRARAG